MPHNIYLKNLKASNVKDAQEGSALSLCFIEGFVYTS